MQPARAILADGDRVGRLVRRLQAQRSVWAMLVVVPHVDAQHPLQMAASDDQQPVQALGPDGTNPTLRVGVAVGACTGVRMISAPSEPNTSSKLRQNFASRSRSR
jgi:hypothetical protein